MGHRGHACGGVDSDRGLAMVEISQTRTERPFESRPLRKEFMIALNQLRESAAELSGTRFVQLRITWVFSGRRLFIVKVAIQGQWTRSAALNDALSIHSEIAEARLERMWA